MHFLIFQNCGNMEESTALVIELVSFYYLGIVALDFKRSVGEFSSFTNIEIAKLEATWSLCAEEQLVITPIKHLQALIL